MHVAKYWPEIPPLALREAILGQIWPACFAVLLEQALVFSRMKSHDKKQILFDRWCRLVTTGIPVVAPQKFFIGLNKIGSEKQILESLSPVKAFSKWGFLESELQINKIASYPRDSYSQTSRLNLIRELATTRKQLTTQDYLEHCHHSITPRQAQRDLHQCPFVKAVGTTRNRKWVLRIPKNTKKAE